MPPVTPAVAAPRAPEAGGAGAGGAGDDGADDDTSPIALRRFSLGEDKPPVALAMPTFGGMTLAELQAHVDRPDAMPGRAAVLLASAAALLRRLPERAAPAIAAGFALVRQRSRPALATGAGGVALLVIAMSSVSHAPGTVDGMTLAEPGGAARPAPMARAFVPDSGDGRLGMANGELATPVAMPTVPRASETSPEERPVREPASRDRGRASAGEGDDASSDRESPRALPMLPASVSARLDSAVRGVASGPATLSESFNRRLATIPANRFPSLDDDPAESARASQPPRLVGEAARAQYPLALAGSGLSGEVRIEFAVDTTGRVDPGSLEVVHSDHELFTTAVRRTIPGMRFAPALAGGRKTRGKVAMRFEFAEQKSTRRLP